jgi:hypothetical protein
MPQDVYVCTTHRVAQCELTKHYTRAQYQRVIRPSNRRYYTLKEGNCHLCIPRETDDEGFTHTEVIGGRHVPEQVS